MNKKVESFFEVSAAFGEAFLRRSGRGFIEGANVASRIVGQFIIVSLAVFFSMQVLEAEKKCFVGPSIADHTELKQPPIMPTQDGSMDAGAVLLKSGEK